MTAKPIDYTTLVRRDLPPAGTKWGGFPKYNFVGGHNDPESTPVADLVKAASAA